jgi:hypothetical protein
VIGAHRSDVVVATCGDVVGIRFGDEDDVALFVPPTTDVLRCSHSDWEALLVLSSSSVQPSPLANLTRPTTTNAEPNKLRSLLIELGVFVG